MKIEEQTATEPPRYIDAICGTAYEAVYLQRVKPIRKILLGEEAYQVLKASNEGVTVDAEKMVEFFGVPFEVSEEPIICGQCELYLRRCAGSGMGSCDKGFRVIRGD